MHKSTVAVLDEKVLTRAKDVCHREHTDIKHLVNKALERYISSQSPLGPSSVEKTFGALKISSGKLKQILKEDIYGAL